VRTRVERLAQQTNGFLNYVESTNIQQVRRQGQRACSDLLKEIFATEAAYG
jgi:hypothetical protein